MSALIKLGRLVNIHVQQENDIETMPKDSCDIVSHAVSKNKMLCCICPLSGQRNVSQPNEGSAHDLPLTQSFTCERGRRLAPVATPPNKLSNNKP